MQNITKDPVMYWNKKVPNTNLEQFQIHMEQKHKIKFETYWDLHKWTIQNYTKFWEELWHYFGIISSEPYEKVFMKTGPGFLDNEWFSGAKLNYAENLLRFRDDRIALICLDELGNEETVTYSQMFDEVKQYAAAFRKNGLKAGDRVACYMSNRKEAIFAMLATTSIGAIWGGPIPYYGAKAASSIVNAMSPKFLITIDGHQDFGIFFPTLDYLPEIVNSTPTIEKVILVITRKENQKKDLSNIRNCVLLEDFLREGRTRDGKVPDIVFEQLPFNHPIAVNFTSGTTGIPKAAVHSIGTIISAMRDHSFTYNMKTGDIYCINSPVGWTLWDERIPGLALGLTVFLYCGSVYSTVNGRNFWDLLDKYRCAKVTLVTSMADKLEKLHIVPSTGTDLSCLERIMIVGSPVKNYNFQFLLNHVKKDVLIGIGYGATEMHGLFAGIDMNMSIYGGEVQVPALGLDIQCFDSKGNSVVGQRGDVVICTPTINFPIYLWKDVNEARLTEIYLSKFTGVWTQHDECWINPKTKGIVIIGRRRWMNDWKSAIWVTARKMDSYITYDDTLKQNGERFGAADIYSAIHSMDEIQDYICVNQQKFDGDSRAVLFVKTRPGFRLTPEVRANIEDKVEQELFYDYVPELIVEVPDIPYNLNNKRMESIVRKIVNNNEVPKMQNIRNPECLKHFVDIPEILNYNKS